MTLWLKISSAVCRASFRARKASSFASYIRNTGSAVHILQCVEVADVAGSAWLCSVQLSLNFAWLSHTPSSLHKVKVD